MALVKVWDSVLGWTNINISHKHYKTDILDFSHSLLEHTVFGLTTGHVLQATSSTTYGFASLPSHMHTKAQISDFAHSHNTTEINDVAYIADNVPKVTRALFDILRADRTAFLPASQIIIEQSIDGGVTWSDAGVSDTDKRKLFTGQRPSIRIPLKNGIRSTDCMLRITITAMRYNVPDGTAEVDKYNYWNSNYVLSAERYCTLDTGWVWLNSINDRVYCKIERATGLNPTSWILDREAYMSGWSGGNYFSLSSNTFGGGTDQPENYWNWRLTFRTCTTENTLDDSKLNTTYSTTNQLIQHIKLTGKNVWAYSNNYMYHDHIYSWDENQTVYFPSKVYTANGALEVVTKNSSNNSLDEPLNLKYNQWYKDDINAYGLNCNNSDIIGVNGIYFADITDSTGEGINFINSNDSTKYDTIYTYNNKLYFHSLKTRGEGLNGSLVLTSANAYTKTQVDDKVFLKSNTDNREVATIPNDYNGKFEIKGFKENTILGLSKSSEGDYSGLLGMRSWGDSSGGYAHEFALTGKGNIYHRSGYTTSWNISWRKIAYKDEIPTVSAWALKPSLDINDIPTIPHTKLSGVINYQELEARLSDYRTAVVADATYATKTEVDIVRSNVNTLQNETGDLSDRCTALENSLSNKLNTNGTAYNSTRWGNYQIRVGSYSSGASGYITFSY